MSDCYAQGSTHTQVHNFKPTEFYGTIKMLNPGKSYIFRIQAETKIGYGPEAIWKQKMPILRKWYCSIYFNQCTEWCGKLPFLVNQLSLIRFCFAMHGVMQFLILQIHDGRYYIGLYFISSEVSKTRCYSTHMKYSVILF